MLTEDFSEHSFKSKMKISGLKSKRGYVLCMLASLLSVGAISVRLFDNNEKSLDSPVSYLSVPF